MSPAPVNVAVTGAAGQICYALLFRIAQGEIFGPEQPVRLKLLEIPPALPALEGTVMELMDCAFPLLAGVDTGDDAEKVFDGANLALLVGARPRTQGMERSDLLQANGAIFSAQGAALNKVAADDVRVVVTGNPANTNAMVARHHAPGIPAERFTALTRLDHNRAVSQLAARTGASVADVERVAIWGNHSTTQYPDVSHATVGGTPALELVDERWLADEFIPMVAHRGAEVIAARGASSAASAARATAANARDLFLGTARGDWTSMAVVSDGSYGVPEGLVSSFPVTTEGGDWSIVPDLELSGFSRGYIDASVAELESEREAVRGLGLI